MEELQFKLDGPILDNGVPLHLTASALNNFQSIVDKTFLVATKSKRISAKDREKFYLNATEFRRGSFLTYFEIALQAAQFGLPLVSTIGPQNIWDYTTETFDFLKLVVKATKNGDKPQYHFENNGDVKVQVGDTHHHYHGQVFQIAQLSLPSYRNLTDLLHDNKITEISAGIRDSQQSDIYLDVANKNIFELPTKLEQEVIEIRCEIFDFNKYKNIGKLFIASDGQVLAKGEYSFTVFGNQNNVDYIYSMLKHEVELHCLIEWEQSPFGDDKVYKIHITGVSS